MTAAQVKTGDDVARIAAELQRMYEGPAWHGPSFRETIQGVSATEAGMRPLQRAHTIYELTHHIAAWIGEVESRLRGNPGSNPADGDWPEDSVVDEAAWAEVLARVDARHASLMRFLRQMDAARLSEAVEPNAASPATRKVTAYILLNGLVQHNAYHIGQIAILRKGIS